MAELSADIIFMRVWTAVISLYGFLNLVQSQTTVSYCGNTPADVVFMLDSSNSMWAPHFVQQLEFVSNVTQMFQIGENATQVGLATFNDDVQLQFYLNEFREKDRLLRAIGRVQQSYGFSTATDKAVKFLRTNFFTKKFGVRPHVPHIAIVITDGQSDHMLRTLIEATRARRQKITIFTIGVGSAVNTLELQRMASSPAKEHAFIVDNFSFLNSIKGKLAVKTCLVTAPHPTPPLTSPTTTPISSTIPRAAPTTAAETTTTTTTTTSSTTTMIPITTTTSTTISTKITDSTTATSSLPTTTTWVDVVRKACDKQAVDVVFALDSSDLVSPADFWHQIRFVRDFTLGLDVGFNRSRIGVVLYSDVVVPGFDINDHASLSSAIGDLHKITRTFGGTKIDEVIHYVRTKSFRRTVTRRDTAQLLVLITSNVSSNIHAVKKESKMARKTGINILVVGVGDKVNQEELSIVSGAAKYKGDIDNFGPARERNSQPGRQLFSVESFAKLGEVVMDVAIEACNTEVAPVPVADQACGTRQEADMMFVMDSESAGKKNTKKSLDFIKNVADSMDVSQNTVQLGMMRPEDCFQYLESFRLNSHKDKEHVMSALETLDGGDKIAKLLRRMRKNAFKKREGGRKEAKKIAIILVDGFLQNPLKVLKETRRAQIKGVEVYVIFVGRDSPQPEVRDMCDFPPQNHFFQVPDYDRLKEVEDSLIQLLCDEL